MLTSPRPTCPATLELLTMAPPPVLSITGISWRIELRTPHTLMSKMRRYSPSVACSSGPFHSTPALLNAMSRRPNLSTVKWTIAFTSASFATSVRMNAASPPSFSISLTTCAPSFSRRPVTTTFAPAARIQSRLFCRCPTFLRSPAQLWLRIFCCCSLCSFLWLIDFRSFQDAIFEMRDTRPGDRADRLQLHVGAIEIVEEARAATEEKWNDVNLQFVDKAGREVLLRDISSAAQRHIVAIRCVLGLIQRRFDAVGDEKECCAS